MAGRFLVPSFFIVAVVVGVSAPVSIAETGRLQFAGAECATCCAQEDATCIVCGTVSCGVFPGYYRAQVGSPCEHDH
jgi:hypothetical protein